MFCFQTTMSNKCIRFKRDLCRLDLKPCQHDCPLKKTKEEQELYDADVKFNSFYLHITQLERCYNKLIGDTMAAALADYHKAISDAIVGNPKKGL